MKKRIFIISVMFLLLGIVLFYFLSGVRETTVAVATGPLRVYPTNPRYFTDGSGRAVYLTGSHTWDNLQDSGENGGSLGTFDYTAYLHFMASKNHNFMRMWVWEGGVNHNYYEPLPYVRTSSGKYDLTQFNQAYFDRLRSRVTRARDRGIYVGIMLFQGWSILNAGYGNPWPLHPYNDGNNINGINGDPDGDGEGYEVHSLQVPAITDLQKAYIRKVVDTVNDRDNVLYEITNETPIHSKDWQYEMVRYIKDYERTKPKQHMVGITMFGDGPDGSNSAMFNSPADWVSPGNVKGADYQGDPPADNRGKVVIADTDHIFGVGGGRDWVWKTFTRGLNPMYMDPIDFNQPDHLDPYYEQTRGIRDDILAARSAMGHTLTYANKMNLVAMTPRGDLSSTGYALANPGSEYLIYQPGSGSFTANLQSATYQMEWFNSATGQTSSGGSISGGGWRSFDPPFGGEAVLYLKGPGAGASPAPTATPSASRSPRI